jgi:hypothetical protein
MGERALATSLENTAPLDEAEDVARRDRADKAPPPESPAIRLLDALRTGDDAELLAVCGESTVVTAENMGWSCRGPDEIVETLTEARRRFPGFAFESRTRHIGFGLVIDEARVQDVVTDEGASPVQPADAAQDQGEAETELDREERGAEASSGKHKTAKHLALPEPETHPMWDEPVAERRNLISVCRSG